MAGRWSVAVEPGDNNYFLFFFPVQRRQPLVSFPVCFCQLLLCWFSAASDVLPSLPLLRGGTGGGGLFSFSPMCLFFSSVLPCFPFFLLFLTVVLPAGKTVAAGGDDEVLCSWWCCCGWEEDGELSSVTSSVLLLRFLSS